MKVNYKCSPRSAYDDRHGEKEMLTDHCTWDNDYKSITQKIRKACFGLRTFPKINTPRY